MNNEAVVESLKNYFKGVRTEFSRITWPQKGQVVAETISVIIIVFGFTVAIYVMDVVFKFLLSLINKGM